MPLPNATAEGDDLAHVKLQFLSSLNHEIRTPLSGIMGLTDLLLETPITDDQREYIISTRDCANQLFDLLTSVLEYNALISGSVKLDHSEFRLEEILESLSGEFAGRAAETHLSLAVLASPDLPDVLIGDGARIRQICAILLGNAIKFTRAGTVELVVTRSADSSQLTFEVRDTGIGIPAQRLTTIFDPFNGTEVGIDRRSHGLGLGLAVARSLVRMMGGDIAVSSQPGTGSRFSFTIPCREEEGAPLVEGKASRIHRKVLLVEDDRISQRIMLAILNKAEIPCDAVTDGKSAIEYAFANDYGLVLMDLQMPGIDGFEAARQILASEKCARLPIVALTANSDDATRTRCWQTGMSAFLSKPVQPAQLVSTLQRFLA